MVVGFNHNFRYKGEVYHVQTEDGGLKSPNIVTLLYKGGTILGSQKTSYADITKVDNLDQVVEELMKEQHKEMLRKLKVGDFDEIIAGRRPVNKIVTDQAKSVSTPPQAPVSAPPQPVAVAPSPAPAASVPVAPPPVAEKIVTPPEPPPKKEAPVELGLDDIILSYLVGDDK